MTADSRPAGPIRKGDLIGDKYEVLRVLGGEGRSGMGVVYVCYDRESNAVLALKTFQDRYLSLKKARDAFKKEALAWVHLDRHPNIVRAAWVQELDHRVYIGLEFIAPDDLGRNNLSHYLADHISLEQAISWAIQFCLGMEHAVSKGVTPHRDIKPDNIMITRDGTVKITDFGLAGLSHRVETRTAEDDLAGKGSPKYDFLKATHAGRAAGTIPWMAPEQFEGNADERSDIYSFGVVLYQMASGGRLPFMPTRLEGLGLTHGAQRAPELRSPLFPVIERCLEKEPVRRYASFNEVRQALEELYFLEIGEGYLPPLDIRAREAWELNNKGLSFAALGLLDLAIPEYRRALSIDPDYARGHHNLGIALRDKGLLDEAETEFRMALAIDRDFAEAHSNLGVVLERKGRFKQAISEYRRALAIKPDSAVLHNQLGVALRNKGLANEAISEFRKAMELKADYAAAHCNLGIALQDKGLLKMAISEYRRALAIRPDYALGYYNLGAALYQDNKLSEATEALRSFTRYASPEHAQYVEKVQRLIRSIESA